MLEWFGALARALFDLGYPGVFAALVIEGLGLPFPGDAVMALYGFAAAEGRLHLLPVVLCSIAGYVCGALISYAVSRTYGPWVQERLFTFAMLNRRSMMRTTRLIDRYGAVLLIPGRFLPGVRSVSSYVAGLSQMDLRPFVLYTVIGASLWCSAWVGLGYWLGENAQWVMIHIRSALTWLTGAAALAAAVIWWFRRRQPT
ncbi:MAG: DedA family protein [Alicyclobacillaceae bacterium]|nr:DedA family protein [Alicyclobacillaceae bacterium]